MRDEPMCTTERLHAIASDECIHDHADSGTVRWAAEEIERLRAEVQRFQAWVDDLTGDDELSCEDLCGAVCAGPCSGLDLGPHDGSSGDAG